MKKNYIVYSVNMAGATPTFYGLKKEAVKNYLYLKKYFSSVSIKGYTENEFLKFLFSWVCTL